MRTLLLLLAVLLIVAKEPAFGQVDNCGKQVTYENRNQADPTAIKLGEVSGIAVDKDGVVIPDVCIAIFTEESRLLVSTTTTDRDGKFKIDRLLKGDYRLVAKYAGFCTANISFKLNPRPLQKAKRSKQLVVQLRLKGLDECSFVEYKSFSQTRNKQKNAGSAGN